MANRSAIQILLATYNASAFLPDQFQSYVGQTHTNWSVLARDDESNDRTEEMLSDLARAHPGRIKLVDRGTPNIGASGNFGRLMELADVDQFNYFAFSDCDDFWKPDKLSQSMNKMHELEARFGQSTPLLVHTDLSVVDRSLKPIHSSFWQYQHLQPENSRRLNRQLSYNVVTGCTMLANAPLLRAANPLPDIAPMHDWWISLVAVAIGQVDYVNNATILYRQHGANSIGSKGFNLKYLANRVTNIWSDQGPRGLIKKSQLLARVMLERARPQIPPDRLPIIELWADMPTRSALQRRIDSVRFGLLPGDLARNVGSLVAM
jgi:glycosyltransferase involved in cell wall biosynthesis